MLPVGRGLFACGSVWAWVESQVSCLSSPLVSSWAGGPCLGLSLGRDFPGGGVGGRFPPYVDISCHLVSAFSSNLASLFICGACNSSICGG